MKHITNQLKLEMFIATIILHLKVMMIDIKHCQLKNTLIKLDHT